MMLTKPGRPAKNLRKCSLCTSSCSPKNGDWFLSTVSEGQQIFICRDCERTQTTKYKRATPNRFI